MKTIRAGQARPSHHHSSRAAKRTRRRYPRISKVPPSRLRGLGIRDLTQSHRGRILDYVGVYCTIRTVWRGTSWPNLDFPISTRTAVFPVAAAAPHEPDAAPGFGPSFRFSLFGILFRGAPSHHWPACSPCAKRQCAGQCLCNHVTATTTGESVDSAASSSTNAQNKELLPTQRPVAGGDPGGQRDLDLGSRNRFRRGQWVRPVHEPGPVCLGRRPGAEPPS